MCVEKYVVLRKIALYECASCINTSTGFFFDILKKNSIPKKLQTQAISYENSETC